MPSATIQETENISAHVPDFSREVPQRFWDPPRKLLRALRAHQKWRKRWGPHAWVLQKWAALRYRFWAVVTASDIPISTQLGGGLLLLHPVGVVMHPTATIGPNCLILQHVAAASVLPSPKRIFSREDKISTTLSQMSLEEKIGQIFIVAPDGNLDELLQTYRVGGFILFSRHILPGMMRVTQMKNFHSSKI